MKFLRSLLKGSPPARGTAEGSIHDAIALHQAGRLDDAKRIYERILAADPHHFDCLHLLGVLASQRGDHDVAVVSIGKAIEVDPGNAASHFNLGMALKAVRRYEAAVRAFDRAIALAPGYGEAYSSRGLALQELRDLDGAVASYDRAIAINPAFVEAHYNRANALQEQKRLAEAVEGYGRALDLNPGLAQAWHNLGFALRRLKALPEAIDAFDRAWALDARMPFLEGVRLLTRMDLCRWQDHERDVRDLEKRIAEGAQAVAPFALLAMTDSAALQRRAAETYVDARYPADPSLGSIAPRVSREKIRLGYFSADFRNHPVSYLTAELFELHDRSRFEVYGFSLGADTGDEMRRRLESAFDQLIDVAGESDEAIARRARDLEIDVAIDLGGHTQDARPGVFALRAAPIQASYVGYLGTMGAPYFDYLFADPVLVPEELRDDYSEKIVSLPSYQANDSRRVIADRTFSREELGLPAEGMVFCCFNNAYKIAPSMFSRWMRILDRVPGSVLLLYAANDEIASNLAAEAARHGIHKSRVVFAASLPRAEYLARFRAADLFLDTFPYNGGTVASDALWAGLPVLTRMGNAFASRVAASLLTAMGLPELIARTADEYEARAIELATNPEGLAGLRAKVGRNRATSPLFDTPLFARRMEAACRAMHERHRAGLAPDHIVVAP